MYCIYCKKEVEGTVCSTCGHKSVSSENQWLRFEKIYASYSTTRLEEIVLNPCDYQNDAIIVATYLYDKNAKSDDEILEHQKSVSMKSSREKIWYYSCDGERQGPISTEEIVHMYEQGFMQDTSAVWKEGFDDWKRLDQTEIDLSNTKKMVPPPVKVEDMNNKAIILLLFVPILSTLIQFLIAGIFYIDVSKLWWIAYGLNTLCCSIDYYQIKKAGYNPNKLMVAFLLLIPLYIYKRMELVKGKKWLMSVIWIIVLVIDLLIPSAFWVKMLNLTNPSMITAVQEATFYDYPSVKLKELFDGTLEDCEWETCIGQHNSVLVSVSGILDENKIEIIFEINLDDSFEIRSIWLSGNYCTRQQINEIINYILESYE